MEPESFLRVDVPALSFLPTDFTVQKKYPDSVLRSVEAATFEHREDVLLVLKFIEECLERQRGSWMGFGATASQDVRLLSYDSEKLRDAPINNISSQ